MFTLSVVLGSSILYKDFNSATPSRVLKFTFGCMATFIGVYFITSERPPSSASRPPTHHQHHPPSSPHIETTPLLVVPSDPADSVALSETPPQFLGTGFGYHFTNPRVLQRKGLRSTLPLKGGKEGDLPSTIWTRWRNSEGETLSVGTSAVRSERMGRTQSDMTVPGVADRRKNVAGEGGRTEEDNQSEIVDATGSWGPNRGNSVVWPENVV